MIVSLSGNIPQLISMEGENVSLSGEMVSLSGYAELMGIDRRDVQLIRRGYLTVPERRYFYSKYANSPELMGFLPALLAALPVVTSAVVGIGSLFAGKKNSPQNAQASADATALQAQVAALQAKQTAEETAKAQAAQTNKTLMMVGIPAAAIIAIMLLKRK
jgi:outer membrane murein-binding lipoprotein Lpp